MKQNMLINLFTFSALKPKRALTFVKSLSECAYVMKCFLFTAAVVVFFFSCTGKADGTRYGQHSTVQKKELSCNILFVLGKDFYRYSDIFTYLSAVYDSESIKNHIHILSYSDMTANRKQPRLSMIIDRLDTQPADVLISIGIPEGGARILRTVKETYPTLHIFSLLPVEEILPLEAYSDVVIDFELPDSFTKADRAVDIPAHDVQTLVLCAVTAAEQIDEVPLQEPFAGFARATATAAALLERHGIPVWGGNRYILKPYKDPELNIRSYNYLIFLQSADGAPPEKAAYE